MLGSLNSCESSDCPRIALSKVLRTGAVRWSQRKPGAPYVDGHLVVSQGHLTQAGDVSISRRVTRFSRRWPPPAGVPAPKLRPILPLKAEEGGVRCRILMRRNDLRRIGKNAQNHPDFV